MFAMLGATGFLGYSVVESYQKTSIPSRPVGRTGYAGVALKNWNSNLVQPFENIKSVASIMPLQPVQSGIAIRWEITLMNNTKTYVTMSPDKLSQKFNISSSDLAGLNTNMHIELSDLDRANQKIYMPMMAGGGGVDRIDKGGPAQNPNTANPTHPKFIW